MSDVGTVALVDREIDHLVRVNSIEGVGLAIYKEAGANTVEVSRTVRDAVVGLAQDLPNVTLTEVSDDASLVVAALDDLKNGCRCRYSARHRGACFLFTIDRGDACFFLPRCPYRSLPPSF
ncbi:MAG: hypothetical protein CM1200mP9_04560 [Gammaproteobacteria bacterium]|nr:MAG: hypothetical protein CM1200mP9_04560 [Gammaproteobacteria bacterium]